MTYVHPWLIPLLRLHKQDKLADDWATELGNNCRIQTNDRKESITMGRRHAGWDTTYEATDDGYPVRWYVNEDEYHDVAYCRTREAALVVVEAMQHMNARPARGGE